jgi:hypothetical protein
VIDGYAAYFQKKLDSHFGDMNLSPLERIRSFTDDAAAGMRRQIRARLRGRHLGQELVALRKDIGKSSLMDCRVGEGVCNGMCRQRKAKWRSPCRRGSKARTRHMERLGTREARKVTQTFDNVSSAFSLT